MPRNKTLREPSPDSSAPTNARTTRSRARQAGVETHQREDTRARKRVADDNLSFEELQSASLYRHTGPEPARRSAQARPRRNSLSFSEMSVAQTDTDNPTQETDGPHDESEIVGEEREAYEDDLDDDDDVENGPCNTTKREHDLSAVVEESESASFGSVPPSEIALRDEFSRDPKAQHDAVDFEHVELQIACLDDLSHASQMLFTQLFMQRPNKTIWNKIVGSNRKSLENFRDYYAGDGQLLIDIQAVLEPIDLDEHPKVPMILASANIATLLDKLTTSPTHNLPTLIRLLENHEFPTPFMPHVGLGANGPTFNAAIEQALECRTQRLITALADNENLKKKVGPRSIQKAVATFFCINNDWKRMPDLFTRHNMESICSFECPLPEAVATLCLQRVHSILDAARGDTIGAVIDSLTKAYPQDSWRAGLIDWAFSQFNINQDVLRQIEKGKGIEHVARTAEDDPGVFEDDPDTSADQISDSQSTDIIRLDVPRNVLPINLKTVAFLHGKNGRPAKPRPVSGRSAAADDNTQRRNAQDKSPESVAGSAYEDDIMSRIPTQKSMPATSQVHVQSAQPRSQTTNPKRRFFEEEEREEEEQVLNIGEDFEGDFEDDFEDDRRRPDEQRRAALDRQAMPPPPKRPRVMPPSSSATTTAGDRLLAIARTRGTSTQFDGVVDDDDDEPPRPSSSVPLHDDAESEVDYAAIQTMNRQRQVPRSSGTSFDGDRVIRHRIPWSNRDVAKLLKYIPKYHCGWAKIDEYANNKHSKDRNALPPGPYNPDIHFEDHRNQQAIRDKARNLKVDFLKADLNLPLGFDQVILSTKERNALIARGKNPERREDDVDEDGIPVNTEYDG